MIKIRISYLVILFTYIILFLTFFSRDDFVTLINEGGKTMSKFKNVYVQNAMDVTKKFGDDFNLDISVIKDPYTLISKSKVNLYINFYDTKVCNFLCSMDNNIPCLLGNTNILDSNKRLKELLVVNSDDNIDEIVQKINAIEEYKDDIFKEYNKWRKSYSKQSKKLVTEFMNS